MLVRSIPCCESPPPQAVLEGVCWSLCALVSRHATPAASASASAAAASPGTGLGLGRAVSELLAAGQRGLAQQVADCQLAVAR